MAKDEIVRTNNGAAESVAVNGKKSEMDALLLKKKALEVAEKDRAQQGEQAVDADQAAASADAQAVEVADASDVLGVASDASISPSVMLAGASAAGETGGISNTTLLVGGGVLLAGGAIAIASNSGGGGGSNDGDVASITPSVTSVNEQASQVTFTIQGNAGATVAYTLTGTAKLGEDYTVSPANQVTFDSNGVAVVTITTVADNKTEGAETIVLTAAGVSSTITVNDTSLTPAAVVTIVPDDTTIGEGQTVDFTLTGVAGTSVAFTLGGSAVAADYSVDPAGGTVTFDATGTAHVRVTALSDNSVEAAETVTLTAGGITSAAVTITDAAPGTFILTANTDIPPGTPTTFIAGLVFTPGGNDRVNSLQDEDELTGTGNSVLNATLGNPNDNGDSTISPKLTGVATVNAAFSSQEDIDLDLQDSTGVTNVNITRVSDEITAGVINLDKTATELSITNSSALANVNFTYRNNALDGTADDVNLALTNVLLDSLYVGAHEFGTPTQQQIEKLDTTVNSTSQIGFFDSAPRGDGAQTLTFDLKNNSGLRIGRDTDEDGTVFDDGTANGAGLGVEEGVANITVTGAGNIDIAEVGSWGFNDDKTSDNETTGFVFDSTALVGNAFVNISASAGDDLAKFSTGAGDDKILSSVGLFGDVVTNAGKDNVSITGDVITQNVAGKLQSGSISSGDGDDTVSVTGSLQGSVGGGSLVDLGAGNDVVKLGTILGAAPSTGSPLQTADAAPISADKGRAQVALVAKTDGNVNEEASILGGDGNDTAILGGRVLADTTSGLDTDFQGGIINLGAGDDALVFDRTGRGAGSTLINPGASVAGGAGANVLTVDGNANAENVVAVDDLDANKATDILLTGFQTVNLVSEQSINTAPTLFDIDLDGVFGEANVPGEIVLTPVNSVLELANTVDTLLGGNKLLTLPVVNDTDAQTADYTLDLSATADIATINLRNDAGVLNLLPEEGNNVFLIEGDDANYTLKNLTPTQTLITLTTVETLSDANIPQDSSDRTSTLINTKGINPGLDDDDAVLDAVVLAPNLDTVTPGAFDSASIFSTASLFFGDTSADATLNVALADATGNNDTFALTLAGAGDAAINDTQDGVLNPAVTPVGGNKAYENLSLTVNDSAGEFSQGVRAITLEGTDFTKSFTLGGNTKDTLVVSSIGAKTITSTVAGDVVLEVAQSAVLADDPTADDHTITTGAGNDVVDLTNDIVNSKDTINLGGGRNTLVFGNDLRLGGPDSDETFDNLSNIQILEARGTLGGPTLLLTLDDDAQNTGVDTVVLAGLNDDNLTDYTVDPNFTDTKLDLDIGPDFENALTLFVAGGSELDVDNDNDVDLTFNINANVPGFLPDDTFINLTDAGKGQVAFNIVVDNRSQLISDNIPGGNNDVQIVNADASAEIDKITLLDSNAEIDATDGNTEQSGTISLILSQDWAQPGDTLIVDASDIDDDDANDLVDDSDTQDGFFDAQAATYSVDLKATQLNDIVLGSKGADKLDGQAGDDIIFGGKGVDTLTGGADTDVFLFGGDYFPGGFITTPSTSVEESNPTSPDTITDFVTGKDHLFVGVTLNPVDVNPLDTEDNFIGNDNIVNFGRFASVANVGLGDGTLDGTDAVHVIGDHYYSTGEGRYEVDIDGDGDITSADFAVNSAQVNAADVSFVIDTGDGADLIRGGASADDITAGGGDDKVVIVGSISAAQVAQYILDPGLATFLTTEGIDKVVSEAELEAIRGYSELGSFEFQGNTAFEQIDFGAGADTLYVIGETDFTNVTLDDLEVSDVTLQALSNVTITDDQLLTIFGDIIFNGTGDHELHVVTAGLDGDYGTEDDVELTAQQIADLVNQPGPGPYITNAGTGSVFVGSDGVELANVAFDYSADEDGNLAVAFVDPNVDGFYNKAEALVSQTITLSGIDGDIDLSEVAITDGVTTIYKSIDPTTGSQNFTLSAADFLGFVDGTLTVTAYVKDSSGNDTSNSLPPIPVISDTIVLDRTADVGGDLTATFTGNGADNFINKLEQTAVEITVAGLDADGEAAIFIGGNNVGSVTANGVYVYDISSYGIVDGALPVTISVTDDAGNTANGTGDSVTLDTTVDVAPALTVDFADANDLINGTEKLLPQTVNVAGIDPDIVSLTATVTDTLGNFFTSTSVAPAGGTAAPVVNVAGLADGNLTVTITLTDTAGNVIALPPIAEGKLDSSPDLGTPVSFQIVDPNDDGYINIDELNDITVKVTGLDADIDPATFVAGIDDDNDAAGASAYTTLDNGLTYDGGSYNSLTGEATFSGSFVDLGLASNNLFVLGGFSDLAGNQYTGSFSKDDPASSAPGLTLDLVAPTVVSVDYGDKNALLLAQANNAEVDTDNPIVIHFSEALIVDLAGIKLFTDTGGAVDASSYIVSAAGSDVTITITAPNDFLDTGINTTADFYVGIAAGAVTDLAGNSAGAFGAADLNWDATLIP